MNKLKLHVIKHMLNVVLLSFAVIYTIYIYIPNIGIDIIFIMALGILFYVILMPLHELGHYSIAKYFVKKKNTNVQLCLSINKTNCSDWSIFSIKEYVLILLLGTIFKILFCTIGILLSCIFEIYLVVKAFLFTILIEVIGNYQPFFKTSDMKSVFYALENNKIPDTEDTNMSTIKTDFFIRKIYPWLLIPVSIIICKLAIPTLYFIKLILNLS